MSRFYVDVPSDAWYAEDVDYCTEQGLLQGIGNRKFQPTAPVTRAELAAAMARLHRMLTK